MFSSLGAVVGAALVGQALTVAEVPPPAATPAQVIVSGRTSTPAAIEIEYVGQSIPPTFSGDRLHNAEGFEWFVSQHYAFQTDYEPARARFLLTLLELAYPHYVEVFGREVPGMDHSRMAVVYGASADSLRRVLEADGISWDFNGGGITYEQINAGFNFPSGTLQYHQRYIMLHECAHLYQICLNGSVGSTPPWYFEGVADAVAHHVWDEGARRLTMGVLDKPTINNWYDNGLDEYARQPFTAGDILTGARGGRNVGFLLVSYFSSDPDRLARWRVWRDELFRLDKYGAFQEDSARLIEQLFGAPQLDADFDRWIRERRSSFHYVDWGWEQDGDALMSYGWPQSGAFSQTDLEFPPGDRPRYDPLVMDYPLHTQSALVGPVARGVPEPTVGCLVDFHANPDSGTAGMALGVEGRSFLKVLVEQRRRLILDGTDLDAGQCETEFTEAFRDGCAKSFQIGLTLQIATTSLEVTARAGDGEAVQTAQLLLPLNPAQRERLLARPMAVLSRDGIHYLTPYVDDARQPEPDLDVPAPPNRWRSRLEEPLCRLERAAWRLGESSPPSLLALRDSVQAAAGAVPDQQDSIDSHYRAELPRVLRDIENCSAQPDAIEAALTELRRD